MTTDEGLHRRARRLRNLVEPLAANVYFAPEPQQEYADLGLSYLPGYFCSRSACMGQLSGATVAAVFAVFEPTLVRRAVEEGWSHTDAGAILEARRRGATAALGRILDGVPDGAARATELLRRAGEAATTPGHPIASGLLALDWPGDPIGDLWRAADIVREHRGDAHTCAWVACGVTAEEITLLTELWWGIPLKSYAPTRGWSDDVLDATIAGMEDKGWIADGTFTDDGEALRGEIEKATDRQEAGVIGALGDDVDELFDLLQPWTKAVVESGGYPGDPSQLARR